MSEQKHFVLKVKIEAKTREGILSALSQIYENWEQGFGESIYQSPAASWSVEVEEQVISN